MSLYIYGLLVCMLYFIHKIGQMVYYTQAKQFNITIFTTSSTFNHQVSFSLFIMDWPPWPNRILIIGWLSSKPRTEAIENLCYVPLLCFDNLPYTPFLQLLPVVSSHTVSSPQFSSSLYVTASGHSLAPPKSIPSFYLHLQETQATGLWTDCSERSRIGFFAIYCATAFYFFWMYTPISSNTASYIDEASGG